MHTATDLSRSSRALALALVLVAGAARAQAEVPAGLWKERQPPPGWVLVRTAGFEVQSEIGEARTRPLADFLQGLRPHFEALWPPRPRAERQVVKVFSTRENRDAWLVDHQLWPEERPPGAPPSCALFDAFSGDVLAWDTGRLLDDATTAVPVGLGSDLANTLPHSDLQRLYPLLAATTAAYTPDVARDVAHEAWHQYLAANAGPDPPVVPAWLDEGLADWLSAATPGGRPWTLRETPASSASPPLQTGALHEDRLREVLRARRENQLLPLEDLLVRITRQAAVEPPGLIAEGWAAIHFLQGSPEPLHRRVVPGLLDALRAGDDGGMPGDQVLEGLDLPALESAFEAWLEAQVPIDPLADMARDCGKLVAPADLLASTWVKNWYAWHRRNQKKAEAAR